jgi:transcriptional regulator with XRE-family HTH domain
VSIYYSKIASGAILDLMKFCEAFDNVCRTHGIKNVNLSTLTGISETTISRFRNGLRNVDTDDLELLLSALTVAQRNEYFYLLQVHNTDAEGVSVLLGAIAGWLRTKSSEARTKSSEAHRPDSSVLANTR